MSVVILCGLGLNCERETYVAFTEGAKISGIKIDINVIHVNDLISAPEKLDECKIFVIPGGFSYGDHTGSGNALALKLKFNLMHKIEKLINQGRLILGICNGAQVLVRLLPAFKDIALQHNQSGCYQCRWVTLKSTVNTKNSPWLENIESLRIPVAHGEGRFVATDRTLLEKHQVLKYVVHDGGNFPENPNGSMLDTAAVTDETGQILAIMPHPERGMFFMQRDDWSIQKHLFKKEGKEIPKYADGMQIFQNALQYVCKI